jgi:hypothetical protein
VSARLLTVPLLLAALLLAATPAAPAAGGRLMSAPTEPAEGEPELEGEEEGWELECEEVEEGIEECPFDETEEEGGSAEECALRTSGARVVIAPALARLQVLLTYESESPVEASIDVRLSGGGGSLRLHRVRRRLSAAGRLQLTRHLTARQVRRARPASRAVVELRVAGTPANCRRYQVEQLGGRRLIHGRSVWAALN